MSFFPSGSTWDGWVQRRTREAWCFGRKVKKTKQLHFHAVVLVCEQFSNTSLLFQGEKGLPGLPGPPGKQGEKVVMLIIQILPDNTIQMLVHVHLKCHK